jgi:hypothetical protein
MSPLGTFSSLLLSKLTGGLAHPFFQLASLYTVCVGKCPSPLSGAQSTLPFLPCVFFPFAYLWFFFFLESRGQSVQGTMLLYPRVVCGDTTCSLFAHLLVCISQAGALLVSPYLMAGEAMCGLEVKGCWNFASPWWFFLSGVSPASQQDFYFKEHTLTTSPC